ncbi:hypothetical protein ANCCAN_07192 [Ancylostoma caninum]|uniref:Uncharacterized protein n=1 Tax=Ancylostoma caninum TaxID=29170 RepID=A0A368GUM8_ANCCA|nr:hypothetical protein ANCCAN_07192 [Ancylostoma caninum]
MKLAKDTMLCNCRCLATLHGGPEIAKRSSGDGRDRDRPVNRSHRYKDVRIGPTAMNRGGRRDAASAADRRVQISRQHPCKMIPKHAPKVSNNTYT